MLGKLFVSMLNMSLIGSCAIIFVLIARLLLKKAPKIFSYALWGIVLFRLLCPFSFESAFSLMPTGGSPIPQDIIYSTAPQLNTGVGIIDNSINPILPAPNIGDSVNPLQVWIFIGTVIWTLGMLAMLIYSIVAFVKLKQRLFGAVHMKENIYLSDHISSPFVMGVLKAKIFLPSSLSDSEKDFIIAHEMCHVRRFDYITRILGFAALAFHWFNPLAWVAFILSGKDMELSCDEAIMKKTNTDIRTEYSQSLLRFAAGRKWVTATPLAFGEGDTKSRVKNVLNYKKPMLWVLVISVIAVVVVGVGLMANPVGNSILNPSVQEYIPGQGNINGNVDVESYEKISLDFAIGADKYGIAVFKNPHKAFETFERQYADGIAYIRQVNDLPSLSKHNYSLYKKYGLQMTDGTSEQVIQSEFVSRFLDIYENSFITQSPNTDNVEPTVEANILAAFQSIEIGTAKNVIRQQFGEPLGIFSGLHGDIYVAEDKKIVIYYGSDGNYPVTEVNISNYIPEKLTHDQAVITALFSLNYNYPGGECFAEGHIILGYDDSDKNKTKIYTLTAVSHYGFANDNFVNVSGSAFPAVITVDSNGNIEMEQPLDGSEYATSIEKMFPKKYHDRVFSYTDDDRESLKQQQETYATEYLSKIGRDAKIGDYSDFDYKSPTDLGVSVEVSNKLHDFYKEQNNYPSFLGNQERIEDGVRMIYETSYHETQNEIRFSKYVYGSHEMVEQFVFNSLTGKIIK